MGYAHVQMMLYRPFIHYVSQRLNVDKNLDERSYACAAACVGVSRNIVHITTELKKRGLLVGAYWFTMYTTFFGILSLVFFVLENPDKQGTQEILADAMAGRDALKDLAKRSMAADRCSTALEVSLKNQSNGSYLHVIQSLFEKLPGHLKRRSMEIVKPKKRAAPSEPPVSTQVRSSPDLHNSLHKASPSPSQAQRTSTFPANMSGTCLPTHPAGSFGSPRYVPGPGLDPSNFRRSFHELISPAMSGTGTPDSSSTANSMQTPFGSAYPPSTTTQAFMGNTNMPDMGAMMFPSADPFAYPNQAMAEFDQRLQSQQQKPKVNAGLHDTSANRNSTTLPDMFMNNGNENVNPSYDNLQGQLFGPLPPYLMQGQQMDARGLDHNNMSLMIPRPGVSNAFGASQGVGGVVGNGMNFDDIFASSNDDWSSIIGEQGFRA